MRIFIGVLIFAVVVCNAFVFAEEPPVERWVARYNGSGNGDDYPYAIATDNTGNVYVTGYSTGSETGPDYATIKYDANGTQKWVACYNGSGNGDDRSYAIARDNSGNVYVTGYSACSGTGYDYMTIKYDTNGNQKWQASYDGPVNNDDQANAIAVDSFGNIYVTGNSYGSGTSADYATIKYDSNGTQKWAARYNGPGNSDDYAYAIATDNFGNVYVTGDSRGSGTGSDYATIKYDSNGTQKWMVRYNGPGNYQDSANAIAIDNSGNVYVSGTSWGTLLDYATVKYDSNGNQKWVARYNGTGNSNDRSYAMAIDDSCNVYVTGYSHGSGTGSDYATIKYDSNGTQKWVARYKGQIYNSDETAYAIATDNLGFVYVTGGGEGSTFETWDYTTIKYDSNGTQKWIACYSGPAGNNNFPAYALIVLDNSGNVYVTGNGRGSGFDSDYATIKYTQHGVCVGEVEGDLNNDCKVDFADFAIMASHWLECKYAYEGDCL